MCTDRWLFPAKKQAVVTGSLVEMTIKAGKSHMVEYITLLDDMEDEGLTAIANPLLIQDQPTKVILMVLLSHNRELLSPQVERIKPVTVERFHQHL